MVRAFFPFEPEADFGAIDESKEEWECEIEDWFEDERGFAQSKKGYGIDSTDNNKKFEFEFIEGE